MSNEVNTNAVFAAFIEADKALKELPAVKDALAFEQLRSEELDKSLQKEINAKAEAERCIADLTAKLAAKEAELEAATFRSQQNAALVDNLRLILNVPGPVVDHQMTEPAAIVETTPEATVEQPMGKLSVDTIEPQSPNASIVTASSSDVVQPINPPEVANTAVPSEKFDWLSHIDAIHPVQSPTGTATTETSTPQSVTSPADPSAPVSAPGTEAANSPSKSDHDNSQDYYHLLNIA